jgi:hypothetical protein
VLEGSGMSSITANDVLRERLVDAREAAHCLNLQMYLLTHPKERDRLQVPHYRVGKLVRFKLGELMAWMESQQNVTATGDEEVVDA